MTPKSGLQKEVLALYRRALRMAYSKPTPARQKFLVFVQWSFRENANKVTARDVSAIEHLIRQGRRRLEALEDLSVKDCYLTQEMEAWHKAHSARRNL